MSIQFGLWQRFGPAVDERELMELSQASASRASEGTFVVSRRNVGMGVQPFVTHERSKLELRPAVFGDGIMVTLDGRIDNHTELGELLGVAHRDAADSILVGEMFRRWGPDCFSKLIGDWAMALWSPSNETLYLARDHAGTRTLYFEISEERVLWSTVLDTFVGTRNATRLDEAYAARYLCCLPLRNLSPYRGIQAVPPAHYLAVQLRGDAIERHWEPTAKEQIRYPSDIEYEQHFLSLFRQSVERRTGPGAPTVAELSGGMDSSSIVCVSDRMRLESGASPEELLDTVSRFDDSEPNWDERRYFSVVEARRGKSGIHLNIGAENRTFEPLDLSENSRPLTPGIDRYAVARQKQFAEAMRAGNYRVILSGIGGDELLGGVPTPLSELADYLVSFELRNLVRRALEFCMIERTPLLFMLARTAATSAAAYWTLLPAGLQVPPWIPRHLRQIVKDAGIDSAARVPRLGFLPSRIENGISWWRTLETLSHLDPFVTSRYEYRYPYLDRDLVEFLHRIPREQLVRPGRRRSLMRRALKDIVPTEILERPRKGSLIRAPLVALQRSETAIQELFTGSVAAEVGLVDEKQLRNSIAEIAKGTSPRWWMALIKAIQMEFWLRTQKGVLKETADRSSMLKELRPDRGAEGIRARPAVR